MMLGIIVGFLFRKQKFSFISKVITVLIWLLLFILGLEVGGNRQIVSGLAKIGIEAVIITLGAVAGSLIMAALLWKVINKRKR